MNPQTELDVTRLDELAARLQSGVAESLSRQDQQIAGAAIATLLRIVGDLGCWATTAKKLRSKLGIPAPVRPKPARRQNGGDKQVGKNEDIESSVTDFGSDSGDASAAKTAPETDGEDEETAPARDKHGRSHPDQYPTAARRELTHPKLSHGDDCPACARGRLYERIRTFLSIQGQASYKATQNRVHELQCNVCDAVVRPPIPDDLAADGVEGGQTRYTYSAAAVTVMEKYLAGAPWHRLEMMQEAYGTKVPDASMCDMCERVADIALPVVKVLITLAANRPLLHGDDTGVLILALRSALRPDRKTGVLKERSGSHTTCILAPGEHDIVLYFSGIHHTGEMLDRVLAKRDSQLPPPIVMTDGSSSNGVTVCEVICANCNVHAFRKFKDLKGKHPADYAQIASLYDIIFDNDKKTVAMTPDERLRFHQENSQDAFDGLLEYVKDIDAEPNSDLGKAAAYVLNREEALGRFLSIAGAPIDNNNDERQMRPPIRIRDGAHFHRNSAGSGIAAVLLTIMVTAIAAGANVFSYLIALQRFSADVAENPTLWLPWCYERRIEALETASCQPDAAASPPELHLSATGSHRGRSCHRFDRKGPAPPGVASEV